MSYENSPFAKSLYIAGTPKKSPGSSDRFSGDTSGLAAGSSSLLKDSFRRRSSDQFGANQSGNASYLSATSTSTPRGKSSSFITAVENADSSLGSVSRFNTSSYQTPNISPNSSLLGVLNPNVAKQSFSSSLPNTPAKMRGGDDSNTSIFGVSSMTTTPGPSTPLNRAPRRFSSISGDFVRTPPNTFTSASAEEPTGEWQNPSMKKVLDRRSNKEKSAKKVVVNLGVLIVLYLASKLVKALNLTKHFSLFDQDAVYNYASFFRYGWLAIHALLWYNIVVGAIQTAVPQDKCEDIPLTTRQRELLGLPPSPKVVAESQFTPPKYSKTGSPLSSSIKSRKSFDLGESPLIRKKLLAQSPTASHSPSNNAVKDEKPKTSAVTSSDAANISSKMTKSISSNAVNLSDLFTSSPIKPANSTNTILNSTKATALPSTPGANTSTSSPSASKAKILSGDMSFSPSARFLYREGALRDKKSIMSRS